METEAQNQLLHACRAMPANLHDARERIEPERLHSVELFTQRMTPPDGYQKRIDLLDAAHSMLKEVQHEIDQTDEHDNKKIRDLERRVEEIEAFQNDHDHHATVTLINSRNASLIYWNGQYGYTVQIPKNPPEEAVHQAWHDRWIQDIATQRMAAPQDAILAYGKLTIDIEPSILPAAQERATNATETQRADTAPTDRSTPPQNQ